LKANAGVDISTAPSIVFPPPPYLADISKKVVEFWKVLEPFEIAEWAELACDIRAAHVQLIAVFGNGVVFDGKDWEEQRQYHARTLYFKWMGLQVSYGMTQINDGTSAYAPAYLTQLVSLFYHPYDLEMSDLCGYRILIPGLMKNRFMVLLIRI
jgi:hypothetical protein